LLRQQLEQIDPALSGDDEDVPEHLDTRVVLKLQGTTRLDTGPFRGLKLVKLGEGSGWTYAVLSDRESRIALSRLIAEYSGTDDDDMDGWGHPNSWIELLNNINGIELYGPEDRRDPSIDGLTFDSYEVLDILLWPSESANAARLRITSIRSIVQDATARNGMLRVTAVDPRPQTTLVRVTADPALLEALLQGPWVERVRPPIRPAITLAHLVNATIPEPLPMPEGEPVGVIDGISVTANPLLTDIVRALESFPRGHIFSSPDTHGTGVAAVASWGDLDFLLVGGPAPTPLPIVNARVLEPNGTNVDLVGQAHLTITEAVRWLHEEHNVKVINISINRDHPTDTLLASELTATIDALARELNVVFVISAGNRVVCPDEGWLQGYPRYLCDEHSGVAEPGDAALAVTVGSVSRRSDPGGQHSDSLVAIAPTGAASPFTRTGPSRGHTASGSLKPEFVYHGGNWAHDHSTGQLRINDPGIAVVTAIPPTGGRFIGMDTGTSYSAPAVAREIARIATRYPEASANLLRALTALSARQVSGRQLDGIDPLRVSAYGQPDAERVLESHGPKAILTIDTSMATNSVVVHPVPVPYEFAQGRSRRTLRVALAYDPPVRRSRREYTAGQMSVELVRGFDLAEVILRYERQPTAAEVAADPSLLRLDVPGGKFRPSLNPGVSRVQSNTLIRRDFVHGSWDPDDENYFLVVTHNQSPWTQRQRRDYAEQAYGLAVEIADEDRTDLDVHGLVLAKLRAITRAHGRTLT
jgi:subtilisin family serine protease